MTIIFCPKCHRQAAEITKKEEQVELRQNGKVLLALSKESHGNRIGVKCPSGHDIKLNI